jgi:hypothetical protein
MPAYWREDLIMKTIILLCIAAVTMFVTSGCEERHEHHDHYGGAYDGNYRGVGHEQWPGNPPQGHWDRDDDWHPH